VRALEQLVGILGASRALVICTREAQKVAEKLLQTERSEVSFIAFEELYSKLRKTPLVGAGCCPWTGAPQEAPSKRAGWEE